MKLRSSPAAAPAALTALSLALIAAGHTQTLLLPIVMNLMLDWTQELGAGRWARRR